MADTQRSAKSKVCCVLCGLIKKESRLEDSHELAAPAKHSRHAGGRPPGSGARRGRMSKGKFRSRIVAHSQTAIQKLEADRAAELERLRAEHQLILQQRQEDITRLSKRVTYLESLNAKLKFGDFQVRPVALLRTNWYSSVNLRADRRLG